MQTTIKINTKIRKIIAREFLILLGTIILFLILFFSWYGLIELNQNKEKKIESKIENINKIINKNSIPLSQKEYDETIDNEISILIDKGYTDEEILLLCKDLKLKYHIKKRPPLRLVDEYGIPFKTDDTLSSNTKENSISFDNKEYELNISKVKELKKELNKTRLSFFNENIFDRKFQLGMILILLFFPLRYLIYVTKWSITQLRE